MKIWIINGDCNGRHCFDAEDSMNNTSNLFDFHRKDTIENWPGLKVTFISGKKRTDIRPINNITSFTSYSCLFIADEYARQKISGKYNSFQFLPVEPIEKDIANKSSYYLPNLNEFAYVLDEEKSQFVYFRETYVSKIIKYYFLESVKEYPVFYLKITSRENAFFDIFATDEFKDYVESCGITGFSFREVFDFDDPDKEYPLI